MSEQILQRSLCKAIFSFKLSHSSRISFKSIDRFLEASWWCSTSDDIDVDIWICHTHVQFHFNPIFCTFKRPLVLQLSHSSGRWLSSRRITHHDLNIWAWHFHIKVHDGLWRIFLQLSHSLGCWLRRARSLSHHNLNIWAIHTHFQVHHCAFFGGFFRWQLCQRRSLGQTWCLWRLRRDNSGNVIEDLLRSGVASHLYFNVRSVHAHVQFFDCHFGFRRSRSWRHSQLWQRG